MILQKLREDEHCPKCGSRDLALHYERGVFAAMTMAERLLIQCNRCSYGWFCAPLDTPDPALDLSEVVKSSW